MLDIKNFLRKTNWIYSSTFVHALIAYLVTQNTVALIPSFIMDLDHIRFPKRNFKNYIRSRIFELPHQKGDVFHKIYIMIISGILFPMFLLTGENLLYAIFFAIFIHLIQDFLEDYFLFNDIKGGIINLCG